MVKTKKIRCTRCSKPFLKRQLVKRVLSDNYCCKKCTDKFPESGYCSVCSKQFPADELEKNLDGLIFCSEHFPRRVKTVKSDSFGWYVLQVEPGRERKVKKDILRRLKIENKTHLVKRLIVPTKFEERIVPVAGKMVLEGRAETRAIAAKTAQMKAASLEVKNGAEYRYVVFQSKGEERGKEGNDFTWQVKTVPAERRLKMLQVKKFPGYLICKLDYGADMQVIIKRTKHAWGLLLKPVVVGHLIQITWSKRRGGFMWKVRTPSSKDIVAKGGPRAEKDQARSDAEVAKSKVEEFKPTPMKDRESAELLIEQKAVNQVARNPEVRDKASVPFRVGSLVDVIEGDMIGVRSTVEKIDRTDKVNVKAWITVPVLGHPVPYELEYWKLKCVKY